MVTGAMKDYGHLYTIIGLPLDEGEQAISEFIVGRKVETIPHVLGTDRMWSDYGALGTPSWMTITASGETKVGIGSLTRETLIGEWIS